MVVRRLDWYLTILEKEEGIELKHRMQCGHLVVDAGVCGCIPSPAPFLRGVHAARLRSGGQDGEA